jgi:hypothetical protein
LWAQPWVLEARSARGLFLLGIRELFHVIAFASRAIVNLIERGIVIDMILRFRAIYPNGIHAVGVFIRHGHLAGTDPLALLVIGSRIAEFAANTAAVRADVFLPIITQDVVEIGIARGMAA